MISGIFYLDQIFTQHIDKSFDKLGPNINFELYKNDN